MSMRKLTFARAIHEALSTSMEMDRSVICYGLGVDDPKGVFGTTLDLHKRFGSERVFDMPTSENAMTGIAIGAALNGIKSIMTHQRLDFFLLAMDQLVNNAAKWQYMFGGNRSVPITIRLILGRGWGQGPTHSQSLQSWFAHIPGLKVVMPSSPADAKGLLLESIFDPNPVLFLEHRWLHETEGEVPEGDFRVKLGAARIIQEGEDVTIVAYSLMTVEAFHALAVLKDQGVSAELIDLRSISPLDEDLIFKSVKKTGRLLALDTSHASCSVAHDIIAKVAQKCFSQLKAAPIAITLPSFPVPTGFSLTRAFYPGAETIVEKIGEIIGRRLASSSITEQRTSPHDTPGTWFKGPF